MRRTITFKLFGARAIVEILEKLEQKISENHGQQHAQPDHPPAALVGSLCATRSGGRLAFVRAIEVTLPKPEPITFAERIATAFISAIAAALTLLVYFVLNVVFAGKSGSNQPLVQPTMLFSKLSAYIVSAATLAGFLAGSARMANVFSIFWGTHQIWKQEWFQKLCVVLLVVVIAAMSVHFLHSYHA